MLTHAFVQPAWLWLIPAAVCLGAATDWAARRRRTLQAAILGVAPVQPSWARLLLGFCAALCLIVAAAGPRPAAATSVATAVGRDVAIVLDVSRSMTVRDVLPDRLGRARDLAAALIDGLARQGGQRVAVVAFAARPALIVPLTYDLAFARTAIDNLDVAELADTRAAESPSGTRIGAGVRRAVEALEEGRPGSRAVVLLSDGDDPVHDGEWRKGSNGVPVFAIGIGDPDLDSPVPERPDALSRLRPSSLEGLAAATGGRYFPLQRARLERADELLAELPAAEDPDMAIGHSPPVRAPFIAAAMALLAVARLAPRRRWVGVAVATLAVAAGPVDAWMRRGDEALAAGNPEQALELYTRAAERTNDPGQVAFNQGVALAQLGRYRDAELHFRRSLSDATGERRAKALFNLGTCLVKRSVGADREALVDAIEAFRQVLKVDAGEWAADAQHNRAIAERLLAQLPAESRSDGSSGERKSPPDDREPAPSGGDEPGIAQPNGPPRPTDQPNDGRARPTDQPPPPGAGRLPPLSDAAQLQPIAPEDLDRYLKQARERITEARRDRLRSRDAGKSPAYPDW